MEIQGYNMPDDLYYEENHFWVKEEGDLLVLPSLRNGDCLLVPDRPHPAPNPRETILALLVDKLP